MKDFQTFLINETVELSGKHSFFNFLQIIGNHEYHFKLNDIHTTMYKYLYFFITESIKDKRELLEILNKKHSLKSTHYLLDKLKNNQISFFFGLKDYKTLRYGIVDNMSNISYVAGEFLFNSSYFNSIIKYKAISFISKMLINIDIKSVGLLYKIKTDFSKFLKDFRTIKTEIIENRVVKTVERKDFSDNDIDANLPFRWLHNWVQTRLWKKSVEYSVNENENNLEFIIILTQNKINENLSEDKKNKLNNSKPQIGDYVICDSNLWKFDFFDTHIGKIVVPPSGYSGGNPNLLYVKYDNIPVEVYNEYITTVMKNRSTICFYIDQIKYWSKDKEDLIPFLNAKKFGL